MNINNKYGFLVDRGDAFGKVSIDLVDSSGNHIPFLRNHNQLGIYAAEMFARMISNNSYLKPDGVGFLYGASVATDVSDRMFTWEDLHERCSRDKRANVYMAGFSSATSFTPQGENLFIATFHACTTDDDTSAFSDGLLGGIGNNPISQVILYSEPDTDGNRKIIARSDAGGKSKPDPFSLSIDWAINFK